MCRSHPPPPEHTHTLTMAAEMRVQMMDGEPTWGQRGAEGWEKRWAEIERKQEEENWTNWLQLHRFEHYSRNPFCNVVFFSKATCESSIHFTINESKCSENSGEFFYRCIIGTVTKRLKWSLNQLSNHLWKRKVTDHLSAQPLPCELLLFSVSVVLFGFCRDIFVHATLNTSFKI